MNFVFVLLCAVNTVNSVIIVENFLLTLLIKLRSLTNGNFKNNGK